MDSIKKLYLFSFIHNLEIFGAVSIPFFLFWGRLTYTQVFLLQSWFMLWIFILEVPTGTIADKYGRKVSLAMSGLVLFFAALLYSQVPNFYAFLLAEFLWAVGLALVSGADRAIIYDTLKEVGKEKGSAQVFSRFALFETLGRVVAFPLGTLIAGSGILPYPDILAIPMLLTSIPFAVACVIALTMKEPKRTRPDENLILLGIKGINYFRKHKILRSFAIDMALVSATTFFIFWLYQPVLLNSGLDIKFVGFVAAGYNLFGAFLLSKSARIGKATGAKNLLFYSAIIPGVMFILLAFLKQLWFVLPVIFLLGGVKILRQPLFDHYMNRYIKSKDRSTVLSAISMFNRIILMVLYPIVGLISDVSIYHALAFLGVATILFAFLARVDERYLQK